VAEAASHDLEGLVAAVAGAGANLRPA
jgi:hypothetical protein